MSGYKLKYFDIRARGELSRLLFALKGQEYEDIRVTFDQWPKEKSGTPFGWLPTLSIPGSNKTFSDSMAIARYLAKEFGFAGKTPIEQMEVDQVLGIYADAFQILVKLYFEKDVDKKAALQKEAYEQKLPNFFSAFTKILVDNKTGFCVGSSLTVADLSILDLCDHISDAGFLSSYSEVQALLQKVKANGNIKAYLAKRKPSDI